MTQVQIAAMPPNAHASRLDRAIGCALDETFRTKRHVLIAIALRITRSRADAEEVVQVAFLRAYERGVRMPRERLLRWLKITVRRLSIDRLREELVFARYAVLSLTLFHRLSTTLFREPPAVKPLIVGTSS